MLYISSLFVLKTLVVLFCGQHRTRVSFEALAGASVQFCLFCVLVLSKWLPASSARCLVSPPPGEPDGGVWTALLFACVAVCVRCVLGA